jgi:hypothetical protein
VGASRSLGRSEVGRHSHHLQKWDAPSFSSFFNNSYKEILIPSLSIFLSKSLKKKPARTYALTWFLNRIASFKLAPKNEKPGFLNYRQSDKYKYLFTILNKKNLIKANEQ